MTYIVRIWWCLEQSSLVWRSPWMKSAVRDRKNWRGSSQGLGAEWLDDDGDDDREGCSKRLIRKTHSYDLIRISRKQMMSRREVSIYWWLVIPVFALKNSFPEIRQNYSFSIGYLYLTWSLLGVSHSLESESLGGWWRCWMIRCSEVKLNNGRRKEVLKVL